MALFAGLSSTQAPLAASRRRPAQRVAPVVAIVARPRAQRGHAQRPAEPAREQVALQRLDGGRVRPLVADHARSGRPDRAHPRVPARPGPWRRGACRRARGCRAARAARLCGTWHGWATTPRPGRRVAGREERLDRIGHDGHAESRTSGHAADCSRERVDDAGQRRRRGGHLVEQRAQIVVPVAADGDHQDSDRSLPPRSSAMPAYGPPPLQQVGFADLAVTQVHRQRLAARTGRTRARPRAPSAGMRRVVCRAAPVGSNRRTISDRPSSASFMRRHLDHRVRQESRRGGGCPPPAGNATSAIGGSAGARWPRGRRRRGAPRPAPHSARTGTRARPGPPAFRRGPAGQSASRRRPGGRHRPAIGGRRSGASAPP